MLYVSSPCFSIAECGLNQCTAIVAESGTEVVHIHPTYGLEERDLTASYSSWVDDASRVADENPFDFSVYMDEVYFHLILWRMSTQMGLGTVDDSVQLAFGASSPIFREARRSLCCRDGYRR